MSDSFKQEMQHNDVGGMKLSHISSSPSNIPFEFCHKKLSGKLHLVDVIAIIQELNFNKNE